MIAPVNQCHAFAVVFTVDWDAGELPLQPCCEASLIEHLFATGAVLFERPLLFHRFIGPTLEPNNDSYTMRNVSGDVLLHAIVH